MLSAISNAEIIPQNCEAQIQSVYDIPELPFLLKYNHNIKLPLPMLQAHYSVIFDFLYKLFIYISRFVINII